MSTFSDFGLSPALLKGVVELGFGINSEDDMQRIGQFAQRMGYRKVGENYSGFRP